MIYTHVAAGILGAALAAYGTWDMQEWRYGAIEAERLAQVVEAEKKRDKRTYDASTQLEASREKTRTVFKRIEVEVDRIVERPVYRNVCFDDDGMRELADAINETTTP